MPRHSVLSGKPIRYYRPTGSLRIRHLVDEGFQAFNAGRLSEACQIFSERITPAEAVNWGKVNPGVLPDTVVAYCDSTIAFPIFCRYAVGSPNGRRPRKELVHKRDEFVATLTREARTAQERRLAETK